MQLRDLDDVFAAADDEASEIDLHLIGQNEDATEIAPGHQALLEFHRFTGKAGTHVVLPNTDGQVSNVMFGLGAGDSGDPCGPNILNLGFAPQRLPGSVYRLSSVPSENATLAAIAWGLGAYRDTRFKSEAACASRGAGRRPRLRIPEAADGTRVRAIVQGAYLARDLINAPANHLGPDEIATTVTRLAQTHGAECTVHRGEDDAFQKAFPLVHAVGRASPRPPRIVDLTWGLRSHPVLTLIGKGIAFDTGGLDLKPAQAMLLMKKDMGGAAAAISAAHMIMAMQLPVRLRLIVAAAENSVAGNAFRPGDVITSRGGQTVEIGNTDAEGRLVLADAIALADDEAPDWMMTFATLTGSARVGLGADLPAMFSTDDDVARAIEDAGARIGDPVWRMPFWAGYQKRLSSPLADLCNVSEGPFAGAITAALFLKSFVHNTQSFTHFDLFGWRQTARALGPKGGEGHTARAVLEAVEAMTTHATR